MKIVTLVLIGLILFSVCFSAYYFYQEHDENNEAGKGLEDIRLAGIEREQKRISQDLERTQKQFNIEE